MNASPVSDAVYQELAGALRQRLEVIADRAAYERDAQEHLRRLQEVSERIIALQTQLPAPVDPQLAHYLQRCSYDKALAWLEAARASESVRGASPPQAFQSRS